MKVVIAPDKFKEALSARAVAEAIARGVRRVLPDAEVVCVPMADGGEGTVDALLAATGGSFRRTTVAGPLGEPVEAAWGMLGDGSNTAVMEMAAASGLALVPNNRRDPTRTTTFGTGEFIRAALDAGASHILIGIGGSATNDGGMGAAQACGVSFCDASGRRLDRPLTGGDLLSVSHIELAGRDARIAGARIEVACDVDNPLAGPRGAAAVYSPQKGATPAQVELLDRGLSHLADVIERDLGRRVRDFPGAGAAGGLGAGLVAFFDARLRRGIEMVMDAARLRERVAGADLVITGEGRLDEQSMMGKVIAGVGQAAKSAGVPTIALVGCVGTGADVSLTVLQSYHCITPPGTPLADALADTARNLEHTAAEVATRFR
jgi:glycerate kinase